MINPENRYTNLQKGHYNAGTSDHLEHNANSDYWSILLEPVYSSDTKGKIALDFGCGKGRNIQNLKQFEFKRVDGVDISHMNYIHCVDRFPDSKIYNNNGVDLSEIEDSVYDFVMSTIVFQHIPVWDIRNQLLTEIYRVMKETGIFSFQMGYGSSIEPGHSSYFGNFYEASSTNGGADVQITDEQDLINDLKFIGFKNIKTVVSESFSDNNHTHWLYIKCEK